MSQAHYDRYARWSVSSGGMKFGYSNEGHHDDRANGDQYQPGNQHRHQAAALGISPAGLVGRKGNRPPLVAHAQASPSSHIKSGSNNTT